MKLKYLLMATMPLLCSCNTKRNEVSSGETTYIKIDEIYVFYSMSGDNTSYDGYWKLYYSNLRYNCEVKYGVMTVTIKYDDNLRTEDKNDGRTIIYVGTSLNVKIIGFYK